MSTESQIQSFRDTYAALQAEIGKVIVGHTAIVENTLIALFGGRYDNVNNLFYNTLSTPAQNSRASSWNACAPTSSRTVANAPCSARSAIAFAFAR